MKILFVANWKIKKIDMPDTELQPSDYICESEKFWFFKYFKKDCDVDVIDITTNKNIMKIEKKIHFIFHNIPYLIKNRKKYDLILFHGTNGAVLFLLLKRIFRFKTSPITVVDISSFHQASTSGFVFNLCRFVSKKIDLLIYHTSSQIEYFKECFPWLLDKSCFIPVGVDYNYWSSKYKWRGEKSDYCVCVGYRKRDWDTLIKAYNKCNITEKLILIGNDEIQVDNNKIELVPFIPINELMKYLENAKFSILPLDNYNYSYGQLTILQQMAIGLPIVTADVYSVRDYIKHSKGILKYKSNDVEDLSVKLKSISKLNANELKKCSEINKNAVKNILSEEEMAKSFEENLNLLLKNK